jgi:hypothetical protein
MFVIIRHATVGKVVEREGSEHGTDDWTANCARG